MTYFLIFLAVMVAAAAALYVVGLNKPQASPDVYQDVLGAPVANLPPVLLPSTPEPGDVDKLRFSLGLRGYRMDQVDEVLDRLRDELAAKNVRIAQLESGNNAVPAGSKPAANASHGLSSVADAAAGSDADDAGATALATTPASAGLGVGGVQGPGNGSGSGSASGSGSGSGVGAGDGIDGWL